MALESGDFISDLVQTNPLSSDPRSQGDDHIRLIKKVLLQTLLNADGPVDLADIVTLTTEQVITAVKTIIADRLEIQSLTNNVNAKLFLGYQGKPTFVGSTGVGSISFRAFTDDAANPGQLVQKQAAGILGMHEGPWTATSWPGQLRFKVSPVGGGNSLDAVIIWSDGKVEIAYSIKIPNATLPDQAAAYGQVVNLTAPQTVLGEKTFQAEELISSANNPATTRARIWADRRYIPPDGTNPSASASIMGILAVRAYRPDGITLQQAGGVIVRQAGNWTATHQPAQLDLFVSPLDGQSGSLTGLQVQQNGVVNIPIGITVPVPAGDTNPATKKYVDDKIIGGAKIHASGRVTAGGTRVGLVNCTITDVALGRYRVNFTTSIPDINKALFMVTREGDVTTSNEGPMVNYGAQNTLSVDVATRTGGTNNSFEASGFSVMVWIFP